jgi:8-oxo-dGTP pyrophosphatase MutT (NUDIX family)
MSSLSYSAIRKAILSQPRRIEPPGPQRELACVAMVLSGAQDRPSVCLIRRADRPGDPWSGQMAFPGGRAEPTDASPQAVAEREAEEEVGLRLEQGELFGALTEIPVRGGGKELKMKLAAFVYGLDGTPPPLKPQASEVAQALWVPLERIFDPAIRTRFRFEREGASLEFPALALDGHVVWGLTYRVLVDLGERVGQPLPAE